jgi:hypothetical protein
LLSHHRLAERPRELSSLATVLIAILGIGDNTGDTSSSKTGES